MSFVDTFFEPHTQKCHNTKKSPKTFFLKILEKYRNRWRYTRNFVIPCEYLPNNTPAKLCRKVFLSDFASNFVSEGLLDIFQQPWGFSTLKIDVCTCMCTYVWCARVCTYDCVGTCVSVRVYVCCVRVVWHVYVCTSVCTCVCCVWVGAFTLCVCVSVRVYTCVFVYVWICMYVHCVFTCVSVVCVRVYVRLYFCVYVCFFACVYLCMFVCVYAYVWGCACKWVVLCENFQWCAAVYSPFPKSMCVIMRNGEWQWIDIWIQFSWKFSGFSENYVYVFSSVHVFAMYQVFHNSLRILQCVCMCSSHCSVRVHLCKLTWCGLLYVLVCVCVWVVCVCVWECVRECFMCVIWKSAYNVFCFWCSTYGCYLKYYVVPESSHSFPENSLENSQRIVENSLGIPHRKHSLIL